MNFKMKYSDFDELIKYVTEKAKGSALSFEINLEGNLLIKLVDTVGDQVTVEVYPESVDYFPRITKTYRLQEELKK